jgi:hypothetical protein
MDCILVLALEMITGRHNIIPDELFNKIADVIAVKGDGNCLFHTIEFLVNKYHREMRRKVAEFYRSFDINIDYDENSLEFSIKNLLISDDNIDDDGSIHSKRIGENFRYASMCDVAVIALLMKINIIMFHRANEGYTYSKYISGETNGTYFIKFSAKHFEPVIVNFDSLYSSIIRPRVAIVEPNKKTNGIENNERKWSDIPVRTTSKKSNNKFGELMEIQYAVIEESIGRLALDNKHNVKSNEENVVRRSSRLKNKNA